MVTEDNRTEDNTAEAVVRLDGVRKEYGETTALDGVSLEIRAGTLPGPAWYG